MTECRPIAVRRLVIQLLRWQDDIRVFLGQTKIQNWSKMAMDREEWKRIIEQAKTHKDLNRLYKKNATEISIRKEREKE